MVTRAPWIPDEIDFSTFPSSDGQPMADDEVNLEQMIRLILELKQPLEPQGHHVGGNLLVYYDPTDGRRHLAPDVFAALDAGPAFRHSWKTWVEGKFPEVVFEVASPSTQSRDIGEKVRLYAELGAREYYIFDPAGRLDPAFRGYRMRMGRPSRLPNPTGLSIASPLLGLELRVVEGWLRVIDPGSGTPYPLPDEALAQAREAQARAAVAEEQAARAEEQAAREAAARMSAEEQAKLAGARAAEAEAALRAAHAEVARLRAQQRDQK